MNNSYITIIKEKRTALSRKRIPLNQNECTADFRIGVPFEQNLQPVQHLLHLPEPAPADRTVGPERADGGGIQKKPRKSEREMTTPLFLLRCVQHGISIADFDLLTIGLVNDMFTERQNDDYAVGVAWALGFYEGYHSPHQQ